MVVIHLLLLNRFLSILKYENLEVMVIDWTFLFSGLFVLVFGVESF
jgi:hypothetical protein